MLKQACTMCKIVGALAIIGALNWGLVGIANVNVVGGIFGDGVVARLIYLLVGLSGIALLVSYFYICPACRKVKA